MYSRVFGLKATGFEVFVLGHIMGSQTRTRCQEMAFLGGSMNQLKYLEYFFLLDYDLC